MTRDEALKTVAQSFGAQAAANLIEADLERGGSPFSIRKMRARELADLLAAAFLKGATYARENKP